MNLSSQDVLFVGKNSGVVSWYRTGLPSFHLGCDWVGMAGVPGHLDLITSLKRGGHTPPIFENYKIIVLQQVAGPQWLRYIRHLQGQGIKIIYEVDDYLHGVAKVKGHRARHAFTPKLLKDYELCMGAADAMICSTEWLARRYRKFNPNTYVCINSVDTRIYGYDLPARDTLNIGWAGGEGHMESVRAWLPAVEKILDEFPHTRFLSIGLPVAGLLKRPKQAVALPFISIENFPAALTNFDIAIAPAGRGNFFAGKSDLRFLETGALGIPLVADPFVYKDIEDTKTGLLASDADEAYAKLYQLVNWEHDREAIGRNAREHIWAKRDISTGIEQWERTFVSVWDS